MIAFARARLAAVHWLVFFAAIIAAWAALMAMQGAQADGLFARLAAICRVDGAGAGYRVIFAMWALMAAAMMAPTLMPALAVLDDLSRGRARIFIEFCAGYGAIWLGFAAVAAALQLALSASGWIGADGASLSPLLTGGLLIVAGGYQFSNLKAGCVSKCLSPMAFFMSHWSDASWNATAMGLRLGAICLGCCWALMALAFVGGTMNLIWMGLATVLMVSEKLPRMSRMVVRPLGVVLIAAGLGVLSTAFF